MPKWYNELLPPEYPLALLEGFWVLGPHGLVVT